tara:strand:+ start:304 stop:1278 length:975 start_codon:yes stop_codon:yes gene_type:complete
MLLICESVIYIITFAVLIVLFNKNSFNKIIQSGGADAGGSSGDFSPLAVAAAEAAGAMQNKGNTSISSTSTSFSKPEQEHQGWKKWLPKSFFRWGFSQTGTPSLSSSLPEEAATTPPLSVQQQQLCNDIKKCGEKLIKKMSGDNFSIDTFKIHLDEIIKHRSFFIMLFIVVIIQICIIWKSIKNKCKDYKGRQLFWKSLFDGIICGIVFTLGALLICIPKFGVFITYSFQAVFGGYKGMRVGAYFIGILLAAVVSVWQWSKIKTTGCINVNPIPTNGDEVINEWGSDEANYFVKIKKDLDNMEPDDPHTNDEINTDINTFKKFN